MSELVAIICEYNPFHSGHKLQIDELKKRFSDAKIVAIMSGNCTQRAEFAIMNKYSRAEAAVICGVDAVFEIPYPYSSSSAEVFARAGVYIASQLGATHLCFGSENNDIEYLKDIADTVDGDEYKNILAEMIDSDKGISYPKMREKALSKLNKTVPSMPNDILGVEYIRAIKCIDSKIIPVAIKRMGQGYKEYEISDIMSAGAIRKFFYDKGKFVSVPSICLEIYKREAAIGNVLDEKSAKDFIHKNMMMSNPSDFEGIYDMSDGMEYFIISTAEESKNGKDFFEALTSKSFTRARLARVAMYKVLEIESIDNFPKYTTVLAINKNGRDLLKSLKKSTELEILVKIGDYKKMSKEAVLQFEKSIAVDKLYLTLMKNQQAPTCAYKYSPFIQK